MSQDNGTAAADTAESAAVAQAGEARRLEAGGPQGAAAPPSPQALDERNAAFSRPRKPMGPVDSAHPETVPDEA